MANQPQSAISPANPEADASAPFFRRLDWSAFWTATVVTFAVYFYTMAPTVTLEDCGELAVGGDFMGVPHPPGYPIWSMISWFFARTFSFVTFRGQPNPAWSIALVSVVFGALAAGISAMLICRSGADLLRQSRDTLHKADHRMEDALCWIAGVVSSLLFAFSPVEWSQAVIVEVYSLNAFFLVLLFLLTYRWMCRPSDTILVITAFVFGLGLTNYQVLLLAILPLVIAIMLRDMRLFRGFLVAGAPFALVAAGLELGFLPTISQPLNLDCFIYLALNLLALTLVYFFMPRGKVIALTILMAEIGVGFYAYMPLVSDLRNPPMNWGFPRTWEGFNHAISRGQYERIVPTDAFSLRFIHQVGEYFTDLRAQFTLPLALLGFVPFTVWRMRVGGREIKGLNVAMSCAILAVAMLVLQHVLSLGMGIQLPRLDKLFVLGVMAALGIGGLAMTAERGGELWTAFRRGKATALADRIVIGGVGLVGLLLYAFFVKMLADKVGIVTAPLRQAGASLEPGQAQILMLQAAGLVLLMLLPTALTVLAVWLNRGRAQLRLIMDPSSQKWVVATLSCFLVMSLMLIVLANPKGDVQDAFIQRVKFISSHAVYAFWIGYGLLFALAWTDTVFKRWNVVRLVCLGAVLCTPLMPLLQNAYNRELIRLSGGAEQNGHDYGWQFGNYQLRGAAAILEELSPDEEPLPNPLFPPEMGSNAVFYGGTDPGRFVPTYMIYSARVREDVYLITQNALADNTYMNVMRDLYGDQIWIPAQQDSATAFRIYVEEVQNGTRPANAELQIENGRVQVSGALGVMEINGILAKMIFDRNKYRHPFYVEESYVIKWMYPYLTPHGLIMEINADATPLTADNARDDLDFWDWYVRRLHDDPKFLRDVVARKSFSKLRSAIGGLYANRGMMHNAEDAFHEARILYPLSPEANFRLVQEVLLPEGRFGESRDIMQEYMYQDPGNDRVPEFLQQLDRIAQLDTRVRELDARYRAGSLDVSGKVELAQLYQQAQQTDRMMALTTEMLADTNLPTQVAFQLATVLYGGRQFERMDEVLEKCMARMPANSPPEIYLSMARMYLDAQMPQKMVVCLQRYLQINPGDWKAWLDMAYIFMTVNQHDAALRALNQARQVGGAEADALVTSDDRFAPLLQRSAPTSVPGVNLLGLPGGTSRR